MPYPKKKKGKNGGLEDEMFPNEPRDDIFPKEEGIGLFDEEYASAAKVAEEMHPDDEI
jgi:hypothetical protein